MNKEGLETGYYKGERIYTIERDANGTWWIERPNQRAVKGDPDKIIAIRNKIWKEVRT